MFLYLCFHISTNIFVIYKTSMARENEKIVYIQINKYININR